MVSKSLARCIAKISGDGYLYYRYIRYNNKCKELICEFEEDIISEFGKINFTRGITNTGTPFTQIHGKHIINKFLEYLPDYHSDSIRIPDKIKTEPKEIKKEYLRSLFDDEGCACLRLFNKTNEWKRNITLSSNSYQILIEVKYMLLNEFNIKSNKIIPNSKSKDRNFILGITGRDNFISFKKEIGFKVPYKKEKLTLIIESYNNTSKNKRGFKKIKEKLDFFFRSK